MEITPDAAREALSQVQGTADQFRRSVARQGTDWILIAWGAIWIACYLATHWLRDRPQEIWIVWTVGVAVGMLSMAVIGAITARRQLVRSEQMQSIGWRAFWSWAALFVFANIWLVMLWPWHPLQMNAFLVTLVMFGYVMVGLWMQSRFFAGLGIAVALATLAGYLLTWLAGFPYYNLWMAVAGGGALLASGVYIRLAWR